MVDPTQTQIEQVRWWDRDWWKRWLGTFWFLRGVLAAITIANLVPSFLPISRWELLRAFHALFVGWNEVAAYLGTLIGTLPLIPRVPAGILNALLFASSVGIPAGMGGFLSMRSSAVRIPAGMGGFLEMWRWFLGHLKWTTIVVMPLLFFGTYLLFLDPLFAQFFPWPPTWFFRLVSLSWIRWLLLFTLAFYVYVALVNIRGFARGVVLLTTTVVTLQIMYYLNVPGVGKWINDTSAAAIQRSPQ